MKIYECGGKQDPEKMSNLRTAAKDFSLAGHKLAKEMGKAAIRLSKKTGKAAIQFSKNVSEANKNLTLNFMKKHPRLASLTLDAYNLALGASVTGAALMTNKIATNVANASGNPDASFATIISYAGLAVAAGGAMMALEAANSIRKTLKHPKAARRIIKSFIAGAQKDNNKGLASSFLKAAKVKLKSYTTIPSAIARGMQGNKQCQQ